MIASYRMSIGNLHSPGPGLFPFLLGALLILVSLPIVIGALLLMKPSASRSKEPGIWAGIEFKNVLLILAGLFSYAMLLEKIGFLMMAFIFLFILFSAFDSRKWLFALLVSSVVVSITYFLFGVVLKVDLPKGLFRIG